MIDPKNLSLQIAKLDTWLPHDKLLHFLCGATITVLLARWPILAFIVTAIVAVAKELLDAWMKAKYPENGNDPSIEDFVATVAGSMFILLALFLA